MFILYMLLVFALSCSIVAVKKPKPPQPPKPIEGNDNRHLLSGLWVRLRRSLEAEQKASWEDQDLDDVIHDTPGSGIVNVTYSTLERQLEDSSWSTVHSPGLSANRKEITNVRMADLNESPELLPQLEGYWGRSREILLSVCDLC